MLDHFFIWDAIPSRGMQGTYMPFLVLVSYLVASFGSYTGLTLATSMIEMQNPRLKNLLHACGALSLGCGIWSMHFIGMLSYKMNMAVSYNLWLTVASMAIAIVVAYGVLFIAGFERLSLRTLIIGALLLGAAICGMHYAGMAAMEMDADLRYLPGWFLLSVVIAITASGAALWIVFFLERHKGKKRRILQVIAALVMGAAICGMHYTGMIAAIFVPFSDHLHDTAHAVQSFDSLALGIVIATSVIFAISLAFSFVIKEQNAVQNNQDYPFPIKLLVFSSLLTLVAVLWASGSSLYIHQRITQAIQRGMIISQLSDHLAYLDTVIGHALKMEIIAADPKWETAYKDNIQLSNKALQDLEAAITDMNTGYEDDYVEVYRLAQKIDRNTDPFLGSMKDRIFELAQAGKQEEARALFESPDYTTRKMEYSNTVGTLTEDTDTILTQSLSSLATTVFYTLYLGIFIAISLPVAWYFSFRSVRQWRGQLEKTRKTLLANEKQLQLFIGEIEMSRTEAIKAKEKTEKESRTVSLLRNISSSANKAVTIEIAIREVLDLLCHYLDCPIGHAYARDRTHDLLRSTELWYASDHEAVADFIKITDIVPIKRGIGIPGRAWQQAGPVIIDNPAEDPDCVRLLLLPSIKIVTGIAVPLIVKGEVTYVLEFFLPYKVKGDDVVVVILQEIGEQLALVDERVRAETALKKAKEDAEQANASKSEFLANMSHELRTPLNSILGMLRLLKEAKLPKEENEMAEMASRSSMNLLEIVNDILDLSKIEAGAMHLENIGMDLHYNLKSVVLTLSPVAREKRLSLTWLNDEENYPYVLGDPTRLARILTNLIGNAIKYTDEGHINIHTSCEKLDSAYVKFRCEVRDTGIGIAKEKQQSVFHKFTQADTTTTRRYGGTGLGLAITKQLVELMKGTIGVESEAGVGSTFWFEIPFEITDRVFQEKRLRRLKASLGVIPSAEAHILVAEDHPMNQVLIKKILEKNFHIRHFKIVGNGIEVLKTYREGSWNVILMDCHMPEKNGYDTTREIRVLEKDTGNHVAIVAMTADAMVGDREECLRCGMDDYISKPVSVDELKELLGQWVRFTTPSTPATVNQATFDTEAPVDMSYLRENLGDDEETHKELIGLFVTQADDNIKIFADINATAKEIAHMLKGGALGLGAETLAGLLNDAQHFSGTEEERAVLFEKITKEYARVKDYLRANRFIS